METMSLDNFLDLAKLVFILTQHLEKRTMNDTFFHLLLIGIVAGFTAIRAYYHRKANRARGHAQYKEGKLLLAFRMFVGIPFIAVVFVYLIQPDSLAWAKLPLPEWTQWAGAALGLASLPLIGWVQWALGANFSTVLHVRDEHTLVTHGPYRWVRHPMYSVLYLWAIAIFLLSQNSLIGAGFLIPLTVIVVTRLKNEEAAMADKFGDAYHRYMQRTGRFLPRLGS
jgi:protein-S-isoprenylcysteine O-methyltransferase Ste14